MNLKQQNKEELRETLSQLTKEYESFKARGLKLDMSRGKPGADQLSLSDGMLLSLENGKDCFDKSGTDARNYGGLEGIAEAREFFAELFEVKTPQIILGNNSSLTMMYDFVSKAYTHGVYPGAVPFGKQEKIKFLAPSPGYDRHFAVSETFGTELVVVPMLSDGPDMDIVEELVANDASIKGIWCVPKYSNPEGKSYSDEVVRRFARLKPAAKDFRIIWDNAYAIHHLKDSGDKILNILDECEKAGNPDLAVMFGSTSKVTYPGAGVAFMASSEANINYMKKLMFFQTIGPDKINQLRHIRFFKDVNGVAEHMKKHAEILKPKFEAVLTALKNELSDIAEFTEPNGGYFVSVDLLDGCAKRTVELAKEAGVVLTGAGATFPYGNDPRDRNIRIAPTFPPVSELKTAIELFCICAKLATAEKLIKE